MAARSTGRAGAEEHLSPERAQAFLGLVRSGEELARALDSQLLAEHRIGLRAFEVLLHLVKFSDGGHLRLTRLTEQAPLSQSRVSRLVAELERARLVRRTSVEGDSRAVEVHITHQGRKVFAAAQRTHLRGLEQRLFSKLTDAELAQLASITTKLLA